MYEAFSLGFVVSGVEEFTADMLCFEAALT
jgi:hypothetical protein